MPNNPSLLLRAQCPTHNFCGGAVFAKDGGGWRCVKAAPYLKWMIGESDMAKIKAGLTRRGMVWEWIR